MDYWPAILAVLTVIVVLTTITVNVLSIKDWLDKHKGFAKPTKADRHEKVDKPSE